MKVLILLSVLAYAKAGLENYWSSPLGQDNNGAVLGPIEVDVKRGFLPRPYLSLTLVDMRASSRLADLFKLIINVPPELLPIHVPSLDPYQRASILPIELKNKGIHASGSISLSNITVTGLKRYRLNDLVLRLKESPRVRLDLDIRLPVLTITSNFRADVFAMNFPLKAQGTISLVLDRLTLVGALGTANFVNGTILNLRALLNPVYVTQVNAIDARITAKNVQVKLVSDNPLLNRIASKTMFLKLGYNVMKDPIIGNVMNLVAQQVNDILAQISAESLLDYLTQP